MIFPALLPSIQTLRSIKFSILLFAIPTTFIQVLALEAVTLSRVTFRKTGVPCSKLTDSNILLQYTGIFSISYPFGSLEILYAGFQFKSTTNGRSTPII